MVNLGNNIAVKNQLVGFGLSQPVVFLVILNLFVVVLFSERIISSLLVFGLIIVVSLCVQSFNYLVVATLRRFKFFMLVVLLFSFFKDFSVTIDTLQMFMKVVDLLLLGICLHYFVDFIYLLNFIDFMFNNISPVCVRTLVRKVMCSLLLGIRFVPEFIAFGGQLKQARLLRGYHGKKNVSARLKDSIGMLIPMFMYSFKKAVEVERAYTVKGFGFDRKRSFYSGVIAGRNDLVFVISSLLLTVWMIIYG